MGVEERDIGIRHDSGETAARCQSALECWHGNAEALHRVGLIDVEELREMLEYADAAYEDVLTT
jgi:hypothetical protein